MWEKILVLERCAEYLGKAAYCCQMVLHKHCSNNNNNSVSVFVCICVCAPHGICSLLFSFQALSSRPFTHCLHPASVLVLPFYSQHSSQLICLQRKWGCVNSLLRALRIKAKVLSMAVSLCGDWLLTASVIYFFPMPSSTSATQLLAAAWIARHSSAPGPLHLLFPLSGSFFPQVSIWLYSPLIGPCSMSSQWGLP